MTTATFVPGDMVRVSARPVAGHCRTPCYLRGKRGVVAAVRGFFADPAALAHHRHGTPPIALYQVVFPYAEVWGNEGNAVTIAADIYEHWLERDGGSDGN